MLVTCVILATTLWCVAAVATAFTIGRAMRWADSGDTRPAETIRHLTLVDGNAA